MFYGQKCVKQKKKYRYFENFMYFWHGEMRLYDILMNKN